MRAEDAAMTTPDEFETEFRRAVNTAAARIEAEQFTPGVRDQDGLLTFHYLSFAGDTGWLGGAYVEAPSLAVAVARAWELGCNPGGQVVSAGFRARAVPVEYMNRLLSEAELVAMPEFDAEPLRRGEPS